jgi:tetratricopeptide (TPR) repeat protein
LRNRFEEKRSEIGKVLEKAKELLKSKEYKKAIEELEKNRFRDIDYYLLLAEAYEGIGNSEKAEIYLEEARFLDTEYRSRHYLQRGITLASMRNFKAAERELLQSVKLNPFEKDAYLELYKLYKEMNSHRKMVKTLETIMTIDPYSKFPYVELSRFYAVRRNYRKAEEVLRRGIELINSADLHYELGRVYAEWGKLEEAKEELREACRLDFKNADYRQKLIEVMVSDEDYEGALQVVHNTLELFPDAVYLLESAAALYAMVGKDDVAEHYYRRAIGLSEGFIREDALKAFSEFLTERGRFDQAEEVLKEIIFHTDNVWVLLDAFSELSVILLDQGRLEEIVEIGKFILDNPELTEDEVCEVSEIVGDVLYELGKFEEAKEFYERILKEAVDERQIKRAYSKLKEVEEVEELEKLLRE